MSEEKRHGHHSDCDHTGEEARAMLQRIADFEAFVRHEYGEAFVESMRAEFLAVAAHPNTTDETDTPAA